MDVAFLFLQLATLVRMQKIDSGRPQFVHKKSYFADELGPHETPNYGKELPTELGQALEAPLTNEEVKMVEGLLLARDCTVESLMKPLQEVSVIHPYPMGKSNSKKRNQLDPILLFHMLKYAFLVMVFKRDVLLANVFCATLFTLSCISPVLLYVCQHTRDARNRDQNRWYRLLSYFSIRGSSK